MKLNKILLLMLLIPLVSIGAKGNKDNKNNEPQEPIALAQPKTSGQVEFIKIDNGFLLTGGAAISFALEGKDVIKSLEKAESYKIQENRKPDGIIRSMTLKNSSGELVSWIVESLRPRMGTSGLSIVSASSEGILNLESGSDSWSIPQNEETQIIWNGKSYLVYASNMFIGKMDDQPPFSCNLIILRQ